MATQQEAIQFILENFPSEKIGDTLIKIIMSWDDGRSQLVFAEVKEDVMAVSSPFAESSAISAQQAINANGTIFGVGMAGDWFALKHVVPLTDVDASEMGVAFSTLAEHADEIEKKLGLGDNL
jgi:hypothetical protein